MLWYLRGYRRALDTAMECMAALVKLSWRTYTTRLQISPFRGLRSHSIEVPLKPSVPHHRDVQEDFREGASIGPHDAEWRQPVGVCTADHYRNSDGFWHSRQIPPDNFRIICINQSSTYPAYCLQCCFYVFLGKFPRENSRWEGGWCQETRIILTWILR